MNRIRRALLQLRNYIFQNNRLFVIYILLVGIGLYYMASALHPSFDWITVLVAVGLLIPTAVWLWREYLRRKRNQDH